MFNLNFKINLKLNLKFISTSISFENQFNFYFVSGFSFKVTSKTFLFYFMFSKFNLSMWPISTSLVHGLFLDFIGAVIVYRKTDDLEVYLYVLLFSKVR